MTKHHRSTAPVGKPHTHLHVVLDAGLRDLLERYAREIDNPAPGQDPNLSAAARDLMRVALGLQTAEPADSIRRVLSVLGRPSHGKK